MGLWNAFFQNVHFWGPNWVGAHALRGLDNCIHKNIKWDSVQCAGFIKYQHCHHIIGGKLKKQKQNHIHCSKHRKGSQTKFSARPGHIEEKAKKSKYSMRGNVLQYLGLHQNALDQDQDQDQTQCRNVENIVCMTQSDQHHVCHILQHVFKQVRTVWSW